MPDQLDLLEARLERAAPLSFEEEARAALPIALRQDEATFWRCVRAAQSKAWRENSKAKPASNRQIWKLYVETGAQTYSQLESFVRFANGYMPYTERLTRIHWIRAIDMATRGRNDFGTYEDLLALSF